MKRVCYTVGAIGLAPIAAGLIAPNIAMASSKALDAPQARTKTVSLHAITAAAPDVGCTGLSATGWINSSQGHAKMRFWYTSGVTSTCIGTVEGHNNMRVPQEYWRVRIWHNGVVKSHSSVFGTSSPAAGFHHSFTNAVKVCAAWVNSRTGSNELPPICRSVG